jgi:hypothetical protein
MYNWKKVEGVVRKSLSDASPDTRTTYTEIVDENQGGTLNDISGLIDQCLTELEEEFGCDKWGDFRCTAAQAEDIIDQIVTS